MNEVSLICPDSPIIQLKQVQEDSEKKSTKKRRGVKYLTVFDSCGDCYIAGVPKWIYTCFYSLWSKDLLPLHVWFHQTYCYWSMLVGILGKNCSISSQLFGLGINGSLALRICCVCIKLPKSPCCWLLSSRWEWLWIFHLKFLRFLINLSLELLLTPIYQNRELKWDNLASSRMK